ncbi:biotin transporter BioY [Marinilactibacillus kalidii]|uniref:biotin transporter BioY n=1 Tax=Marinilactibacillus kalidii TaxID=2820274 RepID=UPI001ABE7728|nr:biotin transporter BioY [Marinilactibacillus kalidii]
MKNYSTKDLMQIALLTSMLSVASVFIIPIGPVPITLQVFFFLLIPALVGKIKGALTITLYMILGLIGFPVFAGGSGGFQSLLSPAFGYIIGAIFVSLVVGRLHQKKASSIEIIGTMFVGIMVLYLIGMTYQFVIMNQVLGTAISWQSIMLTNLTAFLPIDMVKAFTAGIVYQRLEAVLPHTV